MAANVTLDDLRNRIRFAGDFDNSRFGQPSSAIADARLVEVINAAIKYTWDLLIHYRRDHYVVAQSGSPVLAQGSTTVALASDFYKLENVCVLQGPDCYQLYPFNLREAWRFRQVPTDPRSLLYREQGGSLLFSAPSSQTVTLLIHYQKTPTNLVLGTDTFDGINGYEACVIAKAIVDLKMREQTPINEWAAELEKEEMRIRQSASVDDGQPFYLSGLGPRERSSVDDMAWDVWA